MTGGTIAVAGKEGGETTPDEAYKVEDGSKQVDNKKSLRT
jgi:hypothetical protein